MNLKKLFTIAALTGFGASVATGQGTAPTIVQGDYISNVFGNSNFIKNPNAKLNAKDVAVSGATVTRSATTPLVATSEFNVTITSANGTVTWDARAFDAGMKNQNCEARFTYRGFQSTSKVQIKQSTNVVAELALTASTDPRIASINFPCGDLSQLTKFVVTDTSTLSGVHEIGGIYVGLATNMANVAQAETVVIAYSNAAQAITGGTYTTIVNGDEQLDVYGEYNNTTGIFTAKRAGYYSIQAMNTTDAITCNINANNALNIVKNNNVAATGSMQMDKYAESNSSYQRTLHVSGTVQLAVGDTIRVQIYPCVSTNKTSNNFLNYMMISRFPSSSELVVTPERQNVWGGVEYKNQNQSLFAGSAEPTAFSPYTNATWNQPTLLKGKAAVTTTNSGNDLGFSVSNLPVGNYKLDVTGLLNATNGGATDSIAYVNCTFKLVETTTSTDVARQIHTDQSYTNTSGNDETRNFVNAFTGIFNNTSVATRNFRIEAQKINDTTATNSGNCQAYSNTGVNANNTNIAIIMTPLDQPSNSALYVEGPVKASATGAAISAGYVGEVKQANFSPGCLGGATFRDGAAITITPGVWRVTGTFTFEGNTFNDVLLFIGPQSGNNTTWRQSYYNDFWTSLPQITTNSKFSLITPPLLVRYDGTTMYRFENNAWIAAYSSATGELWTKYYYSANCIGTYTSILAERIN